jgi:hypothetical protein
VARIMVLTGLYLVKRGKKRVRKEPVRINKNVVILAACKLWYLYDIPPTTQIVRPLTNCEPVSFDNFFQLSIRKDRKKWQNR